VRSTTAPAGGFPSLGGIVFPDAEHGWTFGGDQLLSTTDGGATWSSQTLGADLNTLSFPDASDGWATGQTAYPSDQAVILHSSDGGASWQTQYSHFTGGAFNFTGLDLLDDQFGWAAGTTTVGRSSRPIVGATTDGGASWRFVTLRHALSGSTAVHFSGPRYGWIACAPAPWKKPVSTIYRTIDGGRTWKLVDITRRGITLHGITFVGDMHGWAVGQNSASEGACVVLRTTNGGRTWSMQKLRAPYYYAGQQVVFTDGSHGWIACGPVVYATTDGGRHWQAQRTGSIVSALAFTNPTQGWAAAETADWTTGAGSILTTTTGGFQPGG
jgi:photosystem II stability/assembly factor-like uncharacterized protein